MGSEKEKVDSLEKLYRLGKKSIGEIRSLYDKICDGFPSILQKTSYLPSNPFKRSIFDDPDFLQKLAEDSAARNYSVFDELLEKLNDDWYEPTVKLLHRIGVRTYILRFEEGETRKQYAAEISLSELPDRLCSIGEKIDESEYRLIALREIIEDYELREQPKRSSNKLALDADREVIAIFSFRKDYSLCVNGKNIHSFQISNSIGDDFRNAFINSGEPIDCKTNSNNIKSTINALHIPPEVRKVFARQSNGKLIINKTVRKSDLIKDFVDESRIEEIIKELPKSNSSKE